MARREPGSTVPPRVQGCEAHSETHLTVLLRRTQAALDQRRHPPARARCSSARDIHIRVTQPATALERVAAILSTSPATTPARSQSAQPPQRAGEAADTANHPSAP